MNVLTGAALTGATVSVYRSIDGGPQAAASGTAAEKGNGQYVFSPSAADLNGNQISFLFLAAGAIPEEKTVVTTAADPTDSSAFGLSRLDIAVSSRSAPATAQQIDLTQTLSAARDLSAVADTSLTLNDALHCAAATTAGRESVVGTTYQTKTSAGTLLRQFTLDSATTPTSRT